MKIKLLIFGLLFCVSSFIANEALSTYKYNPYTRKLDYYEASGTGGSGLWASSTDALKIYPVDQTNVTVLGSTATSSDNTILDVTGNVFIDGDLDLDVGHTYKINGFNMVNQDVTNGSSPTFLGLTLNNIGYTFPSSDGTNGYTLKTNGSGTLTWSADNNTTYTAGDNLTLTGTEFNVDDAFLLNTGDTATGNYNFDSGTLYIDASSDEIGIGTENPSARLHINYPTSGDVIFQAGTGDVSSDMNMRYGYNGYGWYYTYKGSWGGDDNEWQLWSDGAGSTDMQVYGIKQSGNITFMKDMAIEGTLTLNTPLTDAYVSDDLTVNNYMEDTDIDTFAELQSWVAGYTDNDTTYTAGAGLTLSSGAFSVNTSQNIATLSNLTDNGFVKTSGGTGALSIDTSTYLTTVDISANTNLAVTAPVVLTDDTLSVSASSDAARGIVELATITETTAGTDTERAITPDGLAGSSIFGRKTVELVPIAFDADTAVADGIFYFHIPASLNGMNLVSVHGLVATAGTTGTTDWQLYNLTDSHDMLSTKLTIDSGETGSDTAATSAVIDTSYDDVATNDVIRLDCDAVSTTKAKGTVISLEFALP